MREVDCLGKLCPQPIIEIAKAIKHIKIGQSIILLADDPATQPDLLAWARMTGNEVEGLSPTKFLITRRS